MKQKLDDEESDDDVIYDKNVGKDELKVKIQVLEQQNKDLRVELAHYKGNFFKKNILLVFI